MLNYLMYSISLVGFLFRRPDIAELELKLSKYKKDVQFAADGSGIGFKDILVYVAHNNLIYY